MVNNNIYLLCDYNENMTYSNKLKINGCKVGSTIYIPLRMKAFQTGLPDRVPLVCYWIIKNKSCYEVDKMIQISFNNIRLNTLGADGGTEFYIASELTPEILEGFFKEKGIEYQQVIPTEKDFISYRKRLTKEENSLLFNEDEEKESCFQIQDITNIISNYKISKELNFDYKIIQNIIKTHIDFLNKFEHNNQKLIDEQKYILLLSLIYFKFMDKGIWNIFCRFGKTLMACVFCQISNYNKILVLVPSLYLIDQTYKDWEKYYTVQKICCEEQITNDDIKNIYNKEKCIFICTYASCYKLQDYKFDICIYDEAHRISGIKYDDNNKIKDNKILVESKLIKHKLFMTATLKTFNYDNFVDEYYDMDDEQVYGKKIVEISARKAKELNRICPFKIITINCKKNKIDFNFDSFIKENMIPDESKKILEQMKDKYIIYAKGLIDTMKEKNIKHVITFHDRIDNSKFFCQILKTIDASINIQHIDGKMNTKTRNTIINSFQNLEYKENQEYKTNKYDHNILCNAQVLQEGVNMPYCDGIIFIDIKESIIDCVQAVSRCLTNIDNKEAFIMLPYMNDTTIFTDDDTNDLRLVLRNLCEVDENIKTFFNLYNQEKNNTNNEVSESSEINKLKLNFNIDIENKIIDEMRYLSYIPYSKAKELIKNKYCDDIDYMKNIKNDFANQIPINPDIIYKRWWEEWDVFLGMKDSTRITKMKLKKIVGDKNLRDAVDLNEINELKTFLLENKNLNINIYKILDIEFNSFKEFEKYILINKITNIDSYRNIFKKALNFPYNPYEYYKDCGFNEFKWYKVNDFLPIY